MSEPQEAAKKRLKARNAGAKPATDSSDEEGADKVPPEGTDNAKPAADSSDEEGAHKVPPLHSESNAAARLLPETAA